MQLRDLPVLDVRPLLTEERADLLALLRSLTAEEWAAPTDAGHWRVKDVALHLLDDDLGWLSRGRDGDLSSLLPEDLDYRDFVASLDAKNERFVIANAGLSARVLCDQLQWSGKEVADYFATLDLSRADDNVIWAKGAGGVPKWFDVCRDFTERWVHQQHIRDAVGRPGSHDRFLPTVLRTFVWAFPHQLPDVGEVVNVRLGEDAWHLTRRDEWELYVGEAPSEPTASISMSASVAWRQLTGLVATPVETSGVGALAEALLRVRGIIA